MRTMHYFDLKNFPLTEEEILRYLWQPPRGVTMLLLEETLNRLVAEGKIATQNSFYFLPGRESGLATRQRAVVPSDHKLKRAQFAAKCICAVPFLRAILIGNSVAAGTAQEDSDIDFIIIAQENRLWIVRFFCNLILRVLGLRRYGAKVADRICLSFFIDTAHLNLARWRVAPDDPHSAYWLHQLSSLYDPLRYHQRFLVANGWTKQFLPGCDGSTGVAAAPINNRVLGRAWKKIWETMWQGSYGDLIEKQIRGVQENMNKPLLQGTEKKPEGILIAPGIIRLYGSDMPRQLWEQWREAIKNIV